MPLELDIITTNINASLTLSLVWYNWYENTYVKNIIGSETFLWHAHNAYEILENELW